MAIREELRAIVLASADAAIAEATTAGSDGVLTIEICTFGFEQGPRPARDDMDLMFDCRAIVNPSKLSRKGRSGLDKRLREEVLKSPGCTEFVNNCVASIRDVAISTSKDILTGHCSRPVKVGFGCAGGTHRSVSIAIAVASKLGAALRKCDTDLLVEQCEIEIQHLNL